MSNLLQVIRLKPQALTKKSNFPLMVDVPVNPEAAPYLVSSAKGGYLWIDKAHPGDIIRAAVQEIESPGKSFQTILNMVSERGIKENWGNVQPYTEAGVRDAIKYLEFYGLTDVEILVPRFRAEGNKDGPLERPEWLSTGNFDYPLHPTSWLPDNCVLVVPTDREFLGTLAHFSMKHVVIAVHNPSRGLAIAQDRK